LDGKTQLTQTGVHGTNLIVPYVKKHVQFWKGVDEVAVRKTWKLVVFVKCRGWFQDIEPSFTSKALLQGFFSFYLKPPPGCTENAFIH
jgi:hypothetical protein